MQPDGKMGPKTQAALKEFQQQNGIQATGQIDQKTLAALKVESGSSATGGTASPSKGGGAAASGSGSDKPSSKSPGSSPKQ